MKGFAAGVAVGAVLGAAATAAWTGRSDRMVAPSPAVAATIAPPARSDAPRTRRSPEAPPSEDDVARPSPPAPAAASPVFDPSTASLDELLAAVERFLVKPDEGGGDPQARAKAHDALVDAIVTRFPDHRFDVAFVRRVVAKSNCDGQYGRLLSASIRTWSVDATLAEIRLRFDAGDIGVGAAIARALIARDVRLPEDLVHALLRDERTDVRFVGIQLAGSAESVDVATLKEIAAHDIDANRRSQTLYMLRSLAYDRPRVPADDVADAILGALGDPDPDVRSAAECALVAAGPRGAQAAIDILAKDGEVDQTDSLVEAAAAAGRAGDVLDLRLGVGVARQLAATLADMTASHPELLQNLRPRLAELRSAVASSSDPDDASRYFAAVGLALGAPAVVESALDRELDPSTRFAAVDALLERAATWSTGHEVARRLASDRAENARVRLEAIDRLERAPPHATDARQVELHAEAVKFLSDLLRDETNDRVRACIRQALGE
jgi:hypothetical protein